MNETAQQILDVAQELVRSRGYSSFSFADISEQVGIRKASIHYHFSSKEELTRELVKRYRMTFQQKLKQIGLSNSNPQTKLQQFLSLYRQGLSQCQMCLCGILSAEMAVLPASVQAEVRAFFTETQTWLQTVIQVGVSTGCLQPRLSSEDEASLLLASVQGAQLIARASETSELTFDRIADQLLASICPAQ
jgi:TetR/AcrR family transcriptional regulator, transcriptional repressor for nem operon